MAGLLFNLISEAQTNLNSSKLPRTEAEVDSLERLGKSRHFVDTKKSKKGKRVADSTFKISSPKILHISTYSYNFSPDSGNLEKSDSSRIQKIVSDSSAFKKDSVQEGVKTAYEAMNLNLSEVDIVQLSLVDAILFSNWEKGKEKIKETYKDQNLLIAVSEKDSKQRSEFMIKFLELRFQEGDMEQAYLKAFKYITKKYGKNLEFKHYFHKKNK